MPSSKQEEILENFDHIELDEHEIEYALYKAREAKHYQLKREAYNEKLRSDRSVKKYTADQLLLKFKEFWAADGYNLPIIMNLCYYFSGDAMFGGDLNKGLLLVGGVGVGKSTMMTFFRQNQVFSYRMISCREIESDFSNEGEKGVKTCSYNLPISTNSNPFGHQEIGFCFDDLGTEANAKHFGHEKNVMAEIILNRYDNKLDYRATHITTNLTADEIKTQYGSRVTDRMKEMFNLIVFNKDAKSRRL